MLLKLKIYNKIFLQIQCVRDCVIVLSEMSFVTKGFDTYYMFEKHKAG